MKPSIFLDTNVLLDIVLGRREFVEDAKAILQLRILNKAELFTSTLTISYCAYFARKFGKDPKVVVRRLLHWFNVIDLRKEHLENSMLSAFVDFEDGLQYFAAKEIKGMDFIVTRDTIDFKTSLIPVMNPSDFLASFQS